MPAGLRPDAGTPSGRAALFAGLERHRRIGLAVSGGADSLALMLLAARWRAETGGPDLMVYSVDHGLRPEAAAEVAFVRETARGLGLLARGLRWAPGSTEVSQEAARQARYGLIGAAMGEDGVGVLLTAHHRTDQAETVMMRLAHGSGLAGLKGMSRTAQVGDVTLVRPLLDLTQEELVAIAAEAGLAPVADPSNLDPRYERVRWRAAMPVLAALGLDEERIAAFARRAGEADAALATVAATLFEGAVAWDAMGGAHLERPVLRDMPVTLAQRVLGLTLGAAGGWQRPRTLGQIEALAGRLRDAEGVRGETLLGCRVEADERRIAVRREAGRAGLASLVLGAGDTSIWDGRFEIVNGTGGPVACVPGAELSRVERALFAGGSLPAAATAPAVLESERRCLSLGLEVHDQRVTVCRCALPGR